MDTVDSNQAELYNKRSMVWQAKDGNELIDKIFLDEESTVLDLGCGTGNLTSVLADKVGANGHVDGIDPDRERIKVAKENNANNNITFVEADGASFPENQYYLVFSNYVLHWIEDKEAVFKRVCNNLCSGGRFTFTLSQTIPSFFEEVVSLLPTEKAKIYKSKHFFLSMTEIEELATRTGFIVDYKQTSVSSVTFPDFETALELFTATSKGQVNHLMLDKVALSSLQKKYKDTEVLVSGEYATFILTKAE